MPRRSTKAPETATPPEAAAAETVDAAPASPTPEPAPDAPFRASRKMDGWSGERQAAFLEHIADGVSVDTACRMVGLSSASAYAFRRAAAGQAFALGWRAARLVARDRVADELMDRVFQGQTVTITRDDGGEDYGGRGFRLTACRSARHGPLFGIVGGRQSRRLFGGRSASIFCGGLAAVPPLDDHRVGVKLVST